jgi:phospho-N-acetylmuramoyl-pentapeptide-transferase
MLPLPVRPAISLSEILVYSFLAFVLGLLLTKPFVRLLHRYKLGKQLRVEAVDGGSASVFLTYHQKKAGTPTMGGLLIWGSILTTVFLSRAFSYVGTVDHSLLQRGQVYIPLFTLVSFGLLGAFDDYLNILGGDEKRLQAAMPKLKRAFIAGVFFILATALLSLIIQGTVFVMPFGILNSLGLFGLPILLTLFLMPFIVLGLGAAVSEDYLSVFMISQGKRKGLGAFPKLVSLTGIGLFCALWFYLRLDYHTIHLPFATLLGLPSNILDIGWLYVPLFVFVLLGTSNAVNVTDGLDGLASGLLIISFGAFGVMAYLSGLFVLAGFCGVVVGALAAFLWNNIPPASFFMGDTGSLALGGTLAVMAFMIDEVLVLPLIGFVFVLEMLSVILQLSSKRMFKRKIFKSAPLHHHFEALGWGESKVTMRLWIIGAFAAFLGVLVGIYG